MASPHSSPRSSKRVLKVVVESVQSCSWVRMCHPGLVARASSSAAVRKPDPPAHLLHRVVTGWRHFPSIEVAGPDLGTGLERRVAAVLDAHLHPTGQHVAGMAEQHQWRDGELPVDPLERQLGVDRLGDDLLRPRSMGPGISGQGGGGPDRRIHLPLEDPVLRAPTEEATGLAGAPALLAAGEDPCPQPPVRSG